MTTYETMLVLDPRLEDAEIDRMVAKIEDVIVKGLGTIESTARWGRRRLSFEIRHEGAKHREGYYVLVTYKSPGTVPAALDKLFKVTQGLLRFMTTVALPEELRATVSGAPAAPKPAEGTSALGASAAAAAVPTTTDATAPAAAAAAEATPVPAEPQAPAAAPAV